MNRTARAPPRPSQTISKSGNERSAAESAGTGADTFAAGRGVLPPCEASEVWAELSLPGLCALPSAEDFPAAAGDSTRVSEMGRDVPMTVGGCSFNQSETDRDRGNTTAVGRASPMGFGTPTCACRSAARCRSRVARLCTSACSSPSSRARSRRNRLRESRRVRCSSTRSS